MENEGFRPGDTVVIKEAHPYLRVEAGEAGIVSCVDGTDISVETQAGVVVFQDTEVSLFSCPPLSPNQGVKHDQDKPDMSLLSPAALTKIAQVLTLGKTKYGAHNWRKGILWSRVLAAAIRHLFAYLGGQDNDTETGMSHLAHCGCCIMFLLEYEETHQQLDDRCKP